jgi:hypothetical protein
MNAFKNVFSLKKFKGKSKDKKKGKGGQEEEEPELTWKTPVEPKERNGQNDATPVGASDTNGKVTDLKNGLRGQHKSNNQSDKGAGIEGGVNDAVGGSKGSNGMDSSHRSDGTTGPVDPIEIKFQTGFSIGEMAPWTLNLGDIGDLSGIVDGNGAVNSTGLGNENIISEDNGNDISEGNSGDISEYNGDGADISQGVDNVNDISEECSIDAEYTASERSDQFPGEYEPDQGRHPHIINGLEGDSGYIQNGEFDSSDLHLDLPSSDEEMEDSVVRGMFYLFYFIC